MFSWIIALFLPGKGFRLLKEKGNWTMPVVAAAILCGWALWLIWPLLAKGITDKLQAQPQVNTIGTDAALMLARISSYFGVAIGIAAAMFITGLLLFFVNLLVRGEATYMKLVNVALVAYLPRALGGVASGYAARGAHAAPPADALISAAAFLSEKKGALFALANLLNPFTLWGVVLLVVGTVMMSGRPAARVAPYIVIGWLVIGFAGGMLGR